MVQFSQFWRRMTICQKKPETLLHSFLPRLPHRQKFFSQLHTINFHVRLLSECKASLTELRFYESSLNGKGKTPSDRSNTCTKGKLC